MGMSLKETSSATRLARLEVWRHHRQITPARNDFMRRNLAFSLCFVVLASTAGCNLAADVDPEISFASQRVDWTAELVVFASVSAGPRTLLVSGLMLTPNECFSLRANQQIRSGAITITITGTQASNQCGTNPGAYNYQYLTSGIDSGTYQVRIVHVIGSGSQTITDEEIEVG
jgi:hypothetical protein